MSEEERSGVRLTNLDQPLFPDAGVTKRQLVDYLDAMADRLVPVLAGRALSVIRMRPGQPAFMQKNLPAYAPDSVRTLDVPTQDGKKVVHYPVCDDRETLLWFANQRAVEYHPTLFRGTDFDTGFPHGRDQWISAAGTSWACIGLSLAVTPRKGGP